MPSMSARPKVGGRVLMVVLWTTIFLVGVAIALLASVGGLADAVARFSALTVEWKTAAIAAAVAMVLCGLWGISGAYRNLSHSITLISEVDRASKETIALDNTRYMQEPK